MKHISAHYDKVEQACERFAWWPVRSSFSGKLIWLKTYTELEIYYDDMGRPPIKSQKWSLIYTQQEYFLKKLTN
jgi:hypothetical protein